MAEDWKMPRRGERCSRCDASFEVKQSLITCLYESPEGYERRDYCLACGVPDDLAPLATWRGFRPEPSAPRARQFDRQAVFTFFERLREPQTPEQVQLRFVLALLLWRKKALKLRDSRATAAGEVWGFTSPATQESYDVLRPALDEEHIEALSQQVEDLLSGSAAEAMLPLDAHDGVAVSPASPETRE